MYMDGYIYDENWRRTWKRKVMKEDFYRGKHYTNEKGEHVCE